MNSFFTTNGISLSIVLALVGLSVAIIPIRKILASSAGNERMGQIAAAVQEGANGSPSRQTRAVSMIAVLMVVAVWYARGNASTVGFIIGAACSLAAGYIGMMIAVPRQCPHRASRLGQLARRAEGRLQRRCRDGAAGGVALGFFRSLASYAVMVKIAGHQGSD